MRDFNLNFEAIGTRWVIDCFNSSVNKNEIESLVLGRIEEFDKTYSRFRNDSVVYKASQKAGEYFLPEDSKYLFQLYDTFYQVTDKSFTVLIGNTLSEAGYDSAYSLKPKKINRVPDKSQVYDWEFPKLTMKKPYILDLGGLGKGYLVDIISNLLKNNGVKSFCVDAGGDMYCHNLSSPMRVGLENPNDIKQVIGVVEINDNSIAASSGNRRKWADFHHIIDAKNLKSPEKILATWVIAREAIIADGIATSLFFTPPEKLSKYFDFEYFILFPDFTFKKSNKFKGELFLK